MGTDPAASPAPVPAAPPPRRGMGGCVFRVLFLAIVLGAIFMTVWLLHGLELINALRLFFDTFG